ncbi:hypothetical protein N7481_001369 [Penicillium waksmanii]|uniref:uncharacterized protein n=1 Tax=Penicillium waksmanii TaxID=69791 RepID=UPI00254997BB|nr:uncharacterized protein N7481_001369 [Penicillium waksmanii]KAJ6000960.1 hypothetical protein N7481_001369 [Penicillium waksmanii]
MSNKALDPSTGAHQFTFVGGNSPSKARSHAMREYWKQRHRRQQESTPGVGRMARELLPRHQQNKGTSQIQDEVADVSSCRRHDHCDDCEENDSNIAVQLLKGVSCALLGSRPDPFQTCPIHLTSQHQKLLHHWICTHAAMMFDDLDASSFNPMREVWFPLDLSNASSFNCIMAHSAAHLAHLYAGSPPHRGTNSSDALKYKAEAVRILNSWMVDPKKELSDDAFAAVVRLLTFERYWGNDIEWEIHRKGLKKLL